VKVNKIFQIGFNKCGTKSIHRFLSGNGLRSVHWDGGNLAKKIHDNHMNGRSLLQGYEHFDCFTDMEDVDLGLYIPVLYFKELDRQYPGSKFILNIRPVENWITSRLNHRDYIEVSMRTLGMDREEVIEHWRSQWHQHIHSVKEFFKNRPDDLLVFDIETEGDRFIQYMGKFIELRMTEFPHLHKTRKG
jgi:hypothetical protein